MKLENGGSVALEFKPMTNESRSGVLRIEVNGCGAEILELQAFFRKCLRTQKATLIVEGGELVSFNSRQQKSR
jgi:hypothetical protein